MFILNVCVYYRVVVVFGVLLSLLRLLLSLQFDLHGVCDHSSEDGVGLRRLDEGMLTEETKATETE